MQYEICLDAVLIGLSAFGGVVDHNQVITVAQEDFGWTVNLFNGDDIVEQVNYRSLVTGIDFNGAGMCAVNVESIVAVGQFKHKRFEALVLNTLAHTQAGDGRRGQQAAGIRQVITIITDQQTVISAGTGVDKESTDVDAVQAAMVIVNGGLTHDDAVIAFTCKDRGRSRDCFDSYIIVAGRCSDGINRRLKRAIYGEGVVVGRITQINVQNLDRTVGQCAGNAQTGNRGTGQGTVVVGVVPGIIQVQGIGVISTLAIHSQVGIDIIQMTTGIIRRTADIGITADIDIVITHAAIDSRQCCGAADGAYGQLVVTTARINFDIVDLIVGQLQVRGITDGTAIVPGRSGGYVAGKTISDSNIGIQHVFIICAVAGYHQPVVTIGAAVIDIDDRISDCRNVDQVMLSQAAVVGGIIQVDRPSPVINFIEHIADTDLIVQVIHYESIITAIATADSSGFKLTTQIFHYCAGGETITLIADLGCRATALSAGKGLTAVIRQQAALH